MYFITTVTAKGHCRCVGYFKLIEEAIDTVKHNRCDLYEAGEYPYIVIENIDEGLYKYDEKPIWFTWDKNSEKYYNSDKPHFIEDHYIGFGIG